MKYAELNPISKDAVQEALKGPEDLASEALIRAALTIDDRVWVESTLLAAFSEGQPSIRRAAILSFGHLARLHHALNLPVIVPLLKKYVDDPILGGAVEDALEDIAMFVKLASPLES